MRASRSDLWAVVPVKPFNQAKSRLSGRFSADFRIGLARAMLSDVLDCLRRVPELSGVLVVTMDSSAADLARHHGARILPEPTPGGHNAAVNHAAQRLADRQAGAMLVVPGDLPATSPGDFRQLIASHAAGAGLSIVPSRDGEGSNAVLVTPPDLMRFEYGPGSFQRHVAMARAMGLSPRIADIAGIALDIDTADDLLALEERFPEGATRRFVTARSRRAGFGGAGSAEVGLPPAPTVLQPPSV